MFTWQSKESSRVRLKNSIIPLFAVAPLRRRNIWRLMCTCIITFHYAFEMSEATCAHQRITAHRLHASNTIFDMKWSFFINWRWCVSFVTFTQSKEICTTTEFAYRISRVDFVGHVLSVAHFLAGCTIRTKSVEPLEQIWTQSRQIEVKMCKIKPSSHRYSW